MKLNAVLKRAAAEGEVAGACALHMTTAELHAAIATISETLKGPGISFGERMCLNEERRALRAALAAREVAP